MVDCCSRNSYVFHFPRIISFLPAHSTCYSELPDILSISDTQKNEFEHRFHPFDSHFYLHFSFFTTIGTEWASFWRIILFICNTWYYLLAVKCVLFESLILVTSLVTGSMHLIYFQSHDDSILFLKALEKNRQIEISLTWKLYTSGHCL